MSRFAYDKLTKESTLIAGSQAPIAVAGIEDSTTASQAYVVGEYFILYGFLHRVIDAIAQGDTFVPGVNVDLTTVGMELSNVHADLTANNATAGVVDVPFRFGCDDDGNFGYIINEGGADTVHPFKSGGDKPIYLGTGYSFDVSSYSGYQNFTKDNFIVGVQSIPLTSATWYSGQYNHKARVLAFTLDYSYNSSTGIMTVTSYQITVGVGGDSWDNVTAKGNCVVFAYLVP